MENLYHLPVEPYKQRMTEFLGQWEEEAFKKGGFKVVPVTPSANLALNIATGEVLDSIQRPCYAMAQIRELLSLAADYGPVYCGDFFHPGIEALPYSRRQFRAYSFLWAQTFDQYDFTVRFMDWMRPWEVMALSIYRRVFVANQMLKDLIVNACPAFERNILVTGLPFNSEFVKNAYDRSALPEEEFDVVYTSRWDTEKNPAFFVQLVESRKDLSFAICTGHKELRGTDVRAVELIKRVAQVRENVKIFTDLTKGQYYAILARSKVICNTAWQDWTSFTLLEALTYGCLPLYPNFRSFPETFYYDETFLYALANLAALNKKLDSLLTVHPVRSFNNQTCKEILAHHDLALARIADYIRND
jgi:glycosyltransferase involved in cell wall biosynthesis